MAVTKTPRKKPAAAAEAKDPAVRKTKAATEPKAASSPKAAKAPSRGRKAAAEPVVEAPATPPRSPKAKTTSKAKEPADTTLTLTPAPSAPVTTAELPPLAQRILKAIQDGRPVEFIFTDAEAYAPRTFEPRHLLFDALSQAWYVWGWDRRYNAERHHRVELLAEVNDVEGVGRAAQGPFPEGTLGNRIGGWLGGEPIAVKAILLKQWVFAVKQAPPAFPEFQIQDQGDGQALVSFTATDLRAIARWVMQFGDGIQVQEPARLVDRIKQVGAVWAGRERQPAPAPVPRPAPRPEPNPEPRPSRESRSEREDHAPKGKPSKVETVRFDRL